jgi:drug/metabolite transporter (DMT)-like permease
LGGAIFILLAISFIHPESLTLFPSLSDIIYILLLAIVATAIAFVVSISVMKKLSPFTVSLTINLEPLYGIILAVLIFGQEELMSTGFYLGFVLILGTILVNAYLKKKSRRNS